MGYYDYNYDYQRETHTYTYGKIPITEIVRKHKTFMFCINRSFFNFVTGLVRYNKIKEPMNELIDIVEALEKKLHEKDREIDKLLKNSKNTTYNSNSKCKTDEPQNVFDANRKEWAKIVLKKMQGNISSEVLLSLSREAFISGYQHAKK